MSDERVFGHVVRDENSGQVIEFYLRKPSCETEGDTVDTILELYEDGHYHVSQKGNILSPIPCRINADGITLMDDRVKEQLQRCQVVLDSVESYEARLKLYLTLQRSLDILKRWGNTKLYLDFAPLSFGFDGGGLVGGLIFHGPTDGSGPNYSVHLDSSFIGWSLHT